VKEKGQGRPEGAPKEEDRAPKEQGRGHKESAERQSLPSVWKVLESRVRLAAKFNSKDTETRITYEEHELQRLKLSRLSNEISKKGTDRDKLILKLHAGITIQPVDSLPVPFKITDLSLIEFQKFRSKVEPMSDEEIREEIRKAEEEFRRKSKEVDKKRGGDDDDDDFTLAMP
jgi:hypothetical protein